MEFVNYYWVRSTAFACVFSVCVFCSMIFSAVLFHGRKEKSFIQKNLSLAVSGLVCGCLYLWSSFCYFGAQAPSDAKVQYFLMSVFCAVLSLFFLFAFFAHIRGKNLFERFQVLVYAPSIVYLLSLMLFLSFEIGKPDAYNVLAQALTLMFFVYHSNFYVKCSNKNFERRVFVFGVPAASVTLCYALPALIKHLGEFNSLSMVSPLTYIATSAYICIFLTSNMRCDACSEIKAA